VRVAHILDFCDALSLLHNSTAENILLCGRKVVREKGDKFHHKICHLPKCFTLEGFMDEVNCNALMLLSNSHINCPHNLVGLDRRGGIIGGASGRRGVALGVLEPSQMFLNAKGNGRAIWV